MNTDLEVKARPQNWLPIPGCVEESVKTEDTTNVDFHDNFSKGKVISFYPHQKVGYIERENGQRMRFDLNLVHLAGEKTNKDLIREGAIIGYDIGVTSDGPKVCTLKIY